MKYVNKMFLNYEKGVIIIRTKLKKYRQELGFTLEMLAELTGHSKQYLSFVENGKRLGDITFWLKIQEALCLSNDEVMEFIKEGVVLGGNKKFFE